MGKEQISKDAALNSLKWQTLVSDRALSHTPVGVSRGEAERNNTEQETHSSQRRIQVYAGIYLDSSDQLIQIYS